MAEHQVLHGPGKLHSLPPSWCKSLIACVTTRRSTRCSSRFSQHARSTQVRGPCSCDRHCLVLTQRVVLPDKAMYPLHFACAEVCCPLSLSLPVRPCLCWPGGVEQRSCLQNGVALSAGVKGDITSVKKLVETEDVNQNFLVSSGTYVCMRSAMTGPDIVDFAPRISPTVRRRFTGYRILLHSNYALSGPYIPYATTRRQRPTECPELGVPRSVWCVLYGTMCCDTGVLYGAMHAWYCQRSRGLEPGTDSTGSVVRGAGRHDHEAGTRGRQSESSGQAWVLHSRYLLRAFYEMSGTDVGISYARAMKRPGPT
eukprot:3119641-Rhodomonas_salina.5